MNLRNLKNGDLELSFHKTAKSEREVLHIVIEHVQEVMRRKLFLEKGFSSIFDYMTKAMKYSAGSAQRRIEAARLMNDLPEISEKLQSGDLTLSHIGNLQAAVKQAEKTHQKKVAIEKKAALVEQLLNQNNSDTQQICAEALNIPVVKPQKVTTQQGKSRRIEVTLTEEQFAKFEKLKDSLAHKNLQKRRSQSLNDVLETIFDEVLMKLKIPPAETKASNKNENNSQRVSTTEMNHSVSTTEMNHSVSTTEMNHSVSTTEMNHSVSTTEMNHSVSTTEMNHSVSTTEMNHSVSTAEVNHSGSTAEVNHSVSTAEVKFEKWNSLTPKRKRTVLFEDKCCQYEDPRTGKVCGTTFNLHVDHITPKHAGGKNDRGNLRVLCRAHNLDRNRESHFDLNSLR